MKPLIYFVYKTVLSEIGKIVYNSVYFWVTVLKIKNILLIVSFGKAVRIASPLPPASELFHELFNPQRCIVYCDRNFGSFMGLCFFK